MLIFLFVPSHKPIFYSFIGTRISTTFSFGYVALNISHIRAEDSGVYMCKATNKKGEAVSTATLKVRGEYILRYFKIEYLHI